MSENNSFTSHFIELRSRLIKSIIFILLIFIISYTFADQIYNFLVEPYANAVKSDGIERRLIFTALQETFLTYLKVSFFCAFFITCPFILIQIWKFIAPGLYKHEKKAIFFIWPLYLLVIELIVCRNYIEELESSFNDSSCSPNFCHKLSISMLLINIEHGYHIYTMV